VSDFSLNVRHRDTGASWFAHVTVVEQDATLFTFINEYDSASPAALRYQLPYRIENRTLNDSFRFRQHQTRDEVVGRESAPLDWNVLHPFTEQLYTWEEPTHPHVVRVDEALRCYPLRLSLTAPLCCTQVEVQIGLYQDSKLGASYEKTLTFEIEDMDKPTKITLTRGAQPSTVYAHTETDGPTTVFVISELAPLEISTANACFVPSHRWLIPCRVRRLDINDKDSANAEQFQIASEDAKRKEVPLRRSSVQLSSL
jgi:hypothetical protein